VIIPHSKPFIANDDYDAVSNVLASGMISSGSLVEIFEESCAQYLSVNQTVAVNSGTSALILALLALQLKPSAEVILPTYVCRNVVEAVLFAGYKPVFCDVGEIWNMTTDTVSRVLSKHTGAIILVHVFGIPLHARDFLEFGVPLIEDACQAFGINDGNAFAGTTGLIGCYSFHATKCLTTGEGGLLTSHDLTFMEKIRALRDGEDSLSLRIPFQMSDIQAGLGLNQLKKYGEFVDRRKTIALRYFDELQELPIRLPRAVQHNSLFFRFPVLYEGAFSHIRSLFYEKGIHVRKGVDNLLHRMEGLPDDEFLKSVALFDETISLPIYPALSDNEQSVIIDACKEIFQ
jgi:perosamine synthetase